MKWESRDSDSSARPAPLHFTTPEQLFKRQLCLGTVGVGRPNYTQGFLVDFFSANLLNIKKQGLLAVYGKFTVWELGDLTIEKGVCG